jgi:two-component system sensor histidine kinase YesM
MVNSSVMASQFSLDFQKDFDYETYLLIVGNKTLEESSLHAMLEEADEIVAGLEELTESQENRKRLTSVKKYLNNLGTYIGRIEDNIREGNRYEDNIEIWENDVQIVTSLVGDTMSQYIYYEIRGIQESRQQYQDFFVNMIRFSVIAFALILMLCLFLSYYIPLSITRPIRRLTQVTDQVAKGDLTVRSDVTGGLEARVLSDSMNTMIDKINELLEQVKTEQVRLRKAEFELLQSQINPHFLYNTLDAIVWLAEAGEQKKVVSMVGSLSDFFRISLNQGQDILDVREELQHVRSYLEIQQMRYQDILQYEICVPEELYSSRIPKITLQPLVENALYHGIKNKRGKGMIRIDGEMEDSDCILRITDNGRGMTPERLGQVREGIRNRNACETEIYGLYNVNERIRLNFGEKYGITITSTYGEGTCVTVRLPEYTL